MQLVPLQHKMLQQVKEQAQLAFKALEEYSKRILQSSQDDLLFGSNISYNYRVRIEFHNVNLNLQYYPQYTVKLPNSAHFTGTNRATFVLPDESERIFSLQLPANELLSMNNDDQKKSRFLNDYDVIFVDESLKEQVHCYGGFEFCNSGKIIFVPNLRKYGRLQLNTNGEAQIVDQEIELEVFKYTTVPSLNGTCLNVIIGNSGLDPVELSENVVALLELIASNIPFGLQNVKKVVLSNMNFCNEANLELPLYQSIKMSGQTLVPDIRSVQEVVSDELRHLGEINGLWSPQQDEYTLQEEKQIAGM